MLKIFVLSCLLIEAFAGTLPNVSRHLFDEENRIELKERVVGGTPVDITEAPYQVAVLVDLYGSGFYFSTCGGSIISESVVISSAFCTLNNFDEQFNVRAGSTNCYSGGQLIEVLRILRHEKYDPSSSDYDVSLIYLAKSITIDNLQTAIIALPEQDALVADGASAIVTGWGSTEYNDTEVSLQKVTIPIVNQDVCFEAYVNFKNVTPTMICAGIDGKDACEGDLGGPMVVDEVLVGVSSWGRGCGVPGFPGVWSRIPMVRNWIDSNM